jgi:hypothetical protein
VWVPHDVRDQVVDFVRHWSEKTEIGAGRFIHWLGVQASQFYDWRERYGRINEHNGHSYDLSHMIRKIKRTIPPRIAAPTIISF